MNIANRLTISRIVLTFVLVSLLPLYEKIWWASVAGLIIFTFAALTDFFDGRFANKKNMVTDFGKLMDPIADKILVLAAFAAFVQIKLIETWMFTVILSREILITSLRLFALNKGKVLSASKSGKHKTLSQLAVIFLILAFLVFKVVMKRFFTWNPDWDNFFNFGIPIIMYIVVGLTLYSGLTYLWKNRKIISSL